MAYSKICLSDRSKHRALISLGRQTGNEVGEGGKHDSNQPHLPDELIAVETTGGTVR